LRALACNGAKATKIAAKLGFRGAWFMGTRREVPAVDAAVPFESFEKTLEVPSREGSSLEHPPSI